MTCARRRAYISRIRAIRSVIPSAFRGALAGAVVGTIIAVVLALIDFVAWNAFDLFSGELPRDSTLIIALRICNGAIRGVLIGAVVGAIVGGSDIPDRRKDAIVRASVSTAAAMAIAYPLSEGVSTILSFALSNFPDVIISRATLFRIHRIVVPVILLGSAIIGLFVGIPSDYYGGKRRNAVKIVLAGVVVGVLSMIASVMLALILFD